MRFIPLLGVAALVALTGCSTENTPTAAATQDSSAGFDVTVLSVQYDDGYAPAAKVTATDQDAKRADLLAAREAAKATRIAAQEAVKTAREAAKVARATEQKAQKAARIADREAAKTARQAAQAARQAEREAQRLERQAERAATQAARQAERLERLREKDLQNRQDAKEIGPRGGILRVGSKMGPGGRDDIRASLKVPNGALSETRSLTMELQGSTLSDITLVFGPSLNFNESAVLTIHLGRDAVDLDLDTVIALHVIGDDGITEEVPIRMAPGVLGLELQIKIPGFSRYSIGGGT